MRSEPHNEMVAKAPGQEPTLCDGIIRRAGWTIVSIDCNSVCCPAWVCDKCGMRFWSYFDYDNGDESYDLDDDDDGYYDEEED